MSAPRLAGTITALLTAIACFVILRAGGGDGHINPIERSAGGAHANGGENLDPDATFAIPSFTPGKDSKVRAAMNVVTTKQYAWSLELGIVLMNDLVSGAPPFFCLQEVQTYSKILGSPYMISTNVSLQNTITTCTIRHKLRKFCRI